MKIIIQVFLLLVGFVPLIMVLSGGVQGAYDTFVKSYNENGIIWLAFLGCFPIGLIWSWRDYKKGKF